MYIYPEMSKLECCKCRVLVAFQFVCCMPICLNYKKLFRLHYSGYSLRFYFIAVLSVVYHKLVNKL